MLLNDSMCFFIACYPSENVRATNSGCSCNEFYVCGRDNHVGFATTEFADDLYLPEGEGFGSS